MRYLIVSLLCLSPLACLVSGDPPHAESKPQLRFIAGGRFIQGTNGGERALQKAFPYSTAGQNFGNAEGPAHVTWVTQPFWISETEITVGQFRKFVQHSDYQTSAERGLTEMVGWDPTPEDQPLYESHDFQRSDSFSWKRPGFPQSDDHPVVGVSWNDAKAYCDWLGKQEGVTYRLPTEAEWELACRAGTSTWFSFGDRARGVVHEHANFGNVELEKHRKHAAERQWLLDWEHDPEDGFVFTSPVGNFKPNPWGLHDMHGNVWEWCEDLWLDTVYKDYTRPRFDRPNGAAVDPVNSDRPQTPVNDFHIIRGGCWYNGDLICRAANRTYWDADDAACYVGFRIARTANPDTDKNARAAYKSELAAIEAIEAAGGSLYSSDGIEIEVRLEGEAVDPNVFKHLALLPDLRRLRLHWRDREIQLPQSAVDAIAELVGLHSLEFRNGLGIEKLDLSVLTQLENLRELRFPRDASLTDHHLASLASFRSLEEFQCFGTSGGLTDAGLVHLANNRHLRMLLVWESDITGRSLIEFHGCPLETIACTAPFDRVGSMTDAGIEQIRVFSNLQSLKLDGQSQLRSASMKIIGELRALRELSMQRCLGISDQDFG
ncbi:MAG: SUMF1/EgtB/PvdO family nonheme iron enzyme, partial [Rubripirellula sp.]